MIDFVHCAIKAGMLCPDPLVPVSAKPCQEAANAARQRALSDKA